MQILQQHRNTALSFNIGTQQLRNRALRLPEVTPNPLKSHNSLLDTSLHSREKKSSSTHQHTEASFPNPGNLEKPLVQLHPQGGTSTIKTNHKLPEYRKAMPNTAI